METLTRCPNCLAEDDKKFLTAFQPAKKNSLLVDTGIKTLPEKYRKDITVFLVDDDLLYLTAMEHYLSQEIPGLRIKLFQTGESFLLQMEQQPAIVVLDYYLDSKDPSAENGVVILKKIKHLNPVVKVIMLSCQNEFKVARNCIKHGAVDYVSKGEKAFGRIKYLIMNLSGDNEFWID